MEQYLIVNELWGVVSGKETEPTSEAEMAGFLQKQETARADIALHISSSRWSAVRLEADPKKIWDKLQRLNRPRGFGTRIALRRKLIKMRKDPKMPMSKWIASVRDVAHQIKGLKGDVPDEEVIVILTNSLPKSYAPLVAQLDNMEETDCTISHVITCLIGEERRQAAGRHQENHPEKGSLAFHMERRKRREEVTCFRCGKRGHYRSNCPEEQGRGENRSKKVGSARPGTLY